MTFMDIFEKINFKAELLLQDELFPLIENSAEGSNFAISCFNIVYVPFPHLEWLVYIILIYYNQLLCIYAGFKLQYNFFVQYGLLSKSGFTSLSEFFCFVNMIPIICSKGVSGSYFFKRFFYWILRELLPCSKLFWNINMHLLPLAKFRYYNQCEFRHMWYLIM